MQRLWGLVVLPVALLVALGLGAFFRATIEYAYVYSFGGMLIGATAAVALRGFTLTALVCAWFATWIQVITTKVIVGAPEGMTWLEYHTTLFDFIFCYAAAPTAGAAAGGLGAWIVGSIWPRKPAPPAPPAPG